MDDENGCVVGSAGVAAFNHFQFQRVQQAQALKRQDCSSDQGRHRPGVHEGHCFHGQKHAEASLHGDDHRQATRGEQEPPVETRHVLSRHHLPPTSDLRVDVICYHAVRAHGEEESDEQHVHEGQTEQTEVHAVSESLPVEHHTVEKVGRHPDEEEGGNGVAEKTALHQQVGFIADDVVGLSQGK